MRNKNLFTFAVMAFFAVALTLGAMSGCIGKNRNQAQNPEQEQAQAEEPSGDLYYNKATILNVRSAPNTTSEILGKITQGQDVAVKSIDAATNFATIDFNGREAYVSADFIAPRAASTTGKLVATKTGVGPIQLKGAANAVPKSFEGFYDAVKREVSVENYDGEEYTYTLMRFTLGGKTTAVATLYDGVIGAIEVPGPNVCSPEGVSPGMPVAVLFDAGAKTQQWNDGSIYLELNGLLFKVDGSFSKSGDKKVDDGYMTGKPITLTASDYAADAKVGALYYVNY